MIKTETQIAEDNIGKFDLVESKIIKVRILSTMNSHKASCQRFLEFLENTEWSWSEESESAFIDKLTDLKNAIKKYDEAGI